MSEFAEMQKHQYWCSVCCAQLAVYQILSFDFIKHVQRHKYKRRLKIKYCHVNVLSTRGKTVWWFRIEIQFSNVTVPSAVCVCVPVCVCACEYTRTCMCFQCYRSPLRCLFNWKGVQDHFCVKVVENPTVKCAACQLVFCYIRFHQIAAVFGLQMHKLVTEKAL